MYEHQIVPVFSDTELHHDRQDVYTICHLRYVANLTCRKIPQYALPLAEMKRSNPKLESVKKGQGFIPLTVPTLPLKIMSIQPHYATMGAPAF